MILKSIPLGHEFFDHEFGSQVDSLNIKELRQSRNYFDEVWIVVDKNGKPAYLDVKYRETPSPDSNAHMPEKKKVAITRRITRKLSALQFTPAKNGSEAVPYFLVFR